MSFHEWYDEENQLLRLELAHQICTDDGDLYYQKSELIKKGYLINPDSEINIDDLKEDGIFPLQINDDLCYGVSGEIFKLSFASKDNIISRFENQWIPLPYFCKRNQKRFEFGPLNWCRAKLIPVSDAKGIKTYDVLIAFDTHTPHENNDNNKECPVFPDKYQTSIDLALCDNEIFLMDYCAKNKTTGFVNDRIMNLAHPGIADINQLKGYKGHKMNYVASYIFLINYLAKNKLLPQITLYKNVDVEVRDVDMVIDIGNSRTTALLIEDNSNFNQVRPLQLINYTNPVISTDKGATIRTYNEPFDMRLAFRKVDFGNFGAVNSRQFVYPSFVRLGKEAAELIHMATSNEQSINSLSTYSSPKRYLWDGQPNKEEWQFMVLPGETDDHIIELRGVSSQLKSDGQYAPNGEGGTTFHYSRRSLMTLSFLEMLTQAQCQINSSKYRSVQEGLGYPEKPRKIKRIIVTCPTAMSKVEREALVLCAKDAVKIISNFNGDWNDGQKLPIEVIPDVKSKRDADNIWYYDEATCAQLVYVYGEIGHKYKGCCSEFINLYGKLEENEDQPSITIGSLDIGAGTSDLMISRYTYENGDVTTITPDPLFYDSFYIAGDDMLNGMIKNIMLLNASSAFRDALKNLSPQEYRQIIKNFFGPDHNGQTIADRILRKDFNIQYSIPLMCHFLELVKSGHKDCTVRFNDVFDEYPPNQIVIDGFKKRTGIDIRNLQWDFNRAEVSSVIEKELEPLLKKIATIMHAYACDVILLSGRPASLPPIKDIFLKYYAISPDRLITLNNYYVGDWYPFSNNTGYITNPKTIVAMGGVIGHYAAELSNLNKFAINLDKLKENLKSTVNFIESSRDGQPIEYFITPDKPQGDLTANSLPTNLKVRQIGLDSYPCRTLYTIDFNRYRIADKIRRKAIIENNDMPTDNRIQALVKDYIDSLRKRMPFKLTIIKDLEDKEKLSIEAIVDKDNRDLPTGDIDIHIQSLGAEEKYWLDSGVFNF